MIERICANKNCKAVFQAKAADIKRGWGKFCSKSCKAIKQEQRTGQYSDFKHRQSSEYRHYQQEYGGIPQFDRNGNYDGFVCINGSDDHDCNKE